MRDTGESLRLLRKRQAVFTDADHVRQMRARQRAGLRGGGIMSGDVCERLIARIVQMDRSGLIGLLRRMRCDFEMDFSDDYLAQMSVDRLRHIVLAASLHSKQLAQSLEEPQAASA